MIPVSQSVSSTRNYIFLVLSLLCTTTTCRWEQHIEHWVGVVIYSEQKSSFWVVSVWYYAMLGYGYDMWVVWCQVFFNSISCVKRKLSWQPWCCYLIYITSPSSPLTNNKEDTCFHVYFFFPLCVCMMYVVHEEDCDIFSSLCLTLTCYSCVFRPVYITRGGKRRKQNRAFVPIQSTPINQSSPRPSVSQLID